MADQSIFTHWPIYAGLPTPCLLLTPDLTIAAANEAYLLQAAIQDQDITGQHFFDAVQTDAKANELLHASFTAVFNTNTAQQLQLELYGSPEADPCAQSGWNIHNLPGPLKRKKTSYIIHCVTPVNRFEQKIPAGADKAGSKETLVTGIKNYAIFSLDPDGIITSWNKGAENIKGYKTKEIIGKHISLLYTKQDIAAGVPEQNLALALERMDCKRKAGGCTKMAGHFMPTLILHPCLMRRVNIPVFPK